MAHIVRYEVFERPSHPQDGPLHTIALDLPRDQFETQFWPAIQQLSNVPRVFDSLPRDQFERTDFPQQTPTYTVPAGLYNAEDIPAITQLSDSYWLRSTLPLDKFQRTDFAHAPPQWTIPLDLPRDQFSTEFWPALEQSLRSFRSKAAPTLDPRPEWIQQGWLAAAGNHLEVDPANQPALSQQTNSFRTPDHAKLVPQFYTQPEFSWIDGVLGLEEAQQFTAAARQLTDSFRSKAAPVLDPHWTDFPQGTPLLTIPLDLPRDQFSTEFISAIYQQAGSFRSRPAPVLDPRPEWVQQAPLFTESTTGAFETAFFPGIQQLSSSFRSKEGPRLLTALFSPINAWWTVPALRILGSPTRIILAKTRDFILEDKDKAPKIISTTRGSIVKDS